MNKKGGWALCGLLVAGVASADQGSYVEGGIGYQDVELRGSGAEIPFDGAAASAVVRHHVEGAWFIRAGYQYSDVSFDGPADVDGKVKDLRLGLSTVGAIGDNGNIEAEVRAEYVNLQAALSAPGVGSADDALEGAGVSVRFDRVAPTGRFLPYLRLGGVFLNDAEGYEVTAGVRFDFGTLALFAEYNRLGLNADGDLDADVDTALLGVRLAY